MSRILSTGGVPAPGRGLLPGGACSRGCACSTGGAAPEGSAAPGGLLLQGGLLPGGGGVETPLTATAAGGTHPTGMHSC